MTAAWEDLAARVAGALAAAYPGWRGDLVPVGRGLEAGVFRTDLDPHGVADVVAIKALYDGKATPHQQQRALAYIIEVAAGTNDLAYRPGGEDGRRDTDFALGKQSVGRTIIKLIKLPKLNVNRFSLLKINRT